MKSLITLVFNMVIIPLAKEYVAKTTNTYDDKALEFLIELESYILQNVKF